MELSRIVAAIDGTMEGPLPSISISRIASFDTADETSITFLSKPKHRADAAASPACAVITKEAWPIPGKHNIFVKDPYWAYAVVAQLFEDQSPPFGAGISPHAYIDPTAKIGDSVTIGPGCCLGAHTRIGVGTRIDAGVIIEPHVEIGEECIFHSGAIVRSHCRIGARVILSSGAVIGSEGFANAFHEGSFTRIPCFGTVVIEDDVEIGANTTVDRGNFEDTCIKAGARIDNLVQVAHNVEIGESCGIASQVGFAGSTKVGRQVMIGGQAGFAGHISIGDKAFIGAKAGIPGSVESEAKVTGIPAIPLLERRRVDAAERKLPDALKELRRLKSEIEHLKELLQK
ncbi:UDP-3-O-(3-hydroxymyristoyl)glucosamine N-acyltransferase [Chitinivibrio alkaliphilus]|uniref:UDP-3-O-acylglucosamine N-acyltransferase n=1 Tax=Chitinivibrio alkaliphilus ACht1 TaxID=1313304 RepID=U7DBF7_9BACT|nr:UDP-3-O-(3-hydroxymyristoyl)glucosamine N-acyltransferase [Chitinivibrio alkaliphilus]ERP31760.1 UDP-3-O-(3-hydroxymyristoyl) glucosamine N-acyltransferase [Chitinivibrio alkaliphilus ACht1]